MLSESKKYQALIRRLLSINSPLKMIQSIIIFVNSCRHKKIELGNKKEKIKNKDVWDYYHHFPIFTLLGVNYRLTLLHMAKFFL